MFGWIQTGHQLGAAVATFGAGAIREESGTYLLAFVMGLIAAGVLPLSLRRGGTRALQAA